MAQEGHASQPRSGRRMILHVGAQTTGSMSMQRYLNLNRAALAPRLLVRTPRAGTPMRPLGRAAIAFSREPDSPRRRAELVAAFGTVMADLPSLDVAVLISHDNLAGLPPGSAAGRGLYPALSRILRTVCDAATAAGFLPEVAFYTRAMPRWKSSVWAQIVRTDGYTRTEDAFLSSVRDLPDWDDLSARLSAHLPDITISRFALEDDADPDHPARQLLRLCGLDDAAIAALKPLDGPSNERLDTNAIEFVRQLNGLSIDPQARDQVVRLVEQTQALFREPSHVPGIAKGTP